MNATVLDSTTPDVSRAALRGGRSVLVLAGVLLALGTLLGAFGSHALKATLPPDRLEVYETAVLYHFFHALGLLGVGLAMRDGVSTLLRWAAGLIVAGIVLFAGSIYVLTFGAPRALGMVTPLGGIALMAGWSLFALSFVDFRRSRPS
jgi:uncharacterized membrane protein YgdD (TMEM256/DUF423 family)